MEQERTPSFDLEPELIHLASSHSDSIYVEPHRAHIFIFEDDQLPPCVAIDNQTDDWQTTNLLFIKEIKVYDTLEKLGVKTIRWSMPHEAHIDQFTDPENDSDQAEWSAGIPHQTHKDTVVSPKNGEVEDFVFPERENTILFSLETDSGDIPVTLDNSEIFIFNDRPDLSCLKVAFENETSAKYLCTLFSDADHLTELHEEHGISLTKRPYAPEGLLQQEAKIALAHLNEMLDDVERGENYE